jgi:CubicO group peptidase (beta-lactamase class C family)
MRARRTGRILPALLLAAFGSGVVWAGDTPPTAAELGLMVGAPPPLERRVNVTNFTAPPFNRWAYQHINELLPTRAVARGASPSVLAQRPVDLDSVEVQFDAQRRETVAHFLQRSYTDGFIVLHDGAVVYERYFNGQTPDVRHLMFSVTKSLTGALVLMLIEQGRIDPKQVIAAYLPELKDSAFAAATVQQLLDMTNSIAFDEIYTDPNSDIARFGAAFRGGSIYTYLPTLTKPNPHFAHGEVFHYVTADPEVLGWVVRRVTGKNLAEVLSEMIWSKLGADADAYYWLDGEGTEMAGGGLNMTLRDAARFGQMIAADGTYNDRQIVSRAIAQRIKQPGNPAVFGAYYPDQPWYGNVAHAYHDQWWTFANSRKAVSAIGVFGQFIYVDPVANVVIVKQTSHPDAESIANEVDGPMVFDAIANHLHGRP